MKNIHFCSNSNSVKILQFSKICQWILENEKITNATSCIVDVNLMEELLQNLIGNDKINKQQILFDSIGKCGHLQLLFNNCKSI